MFGTRLYYSVLTILLVAQPIVANLVTVPSVPADGPSEALWVAEKHGLDGPKVKPINASSYDWWYFDIVSDHEDDSPNDSLKAITAVFYTAPPAAFPGVALLAQLGYNSIDLAHIQATFSNGTTFQAVINASQADFLTVVDGTSGYYGGYALGDASFHGSSDMSLYSVNITAPQLGLSGSLTFKSIAPAHYAGGKAVAGQDMRVDSHIGWANAVPDANAVANLVIQNQKFDLTGYGYHDKNWGDSPFTENVESWYWGHGRLGDFSVVWFDFLGPNGKHSVSSYVSTNGKIIVAEPSGIQVRPYGPNATYPPIASSGDPEGFHVQVEVPDGILSVNVENELVLAGTPDGTYTRWAGKLTGGLNDATDLQGFSLHEQFVFRLA